MSGLIEIIVAIFLVVGTAFLLAYLNNFIAIGLPSIVLIFVGAAIAIRIVMFIIHRK